MFQATAAWIKQGSQAKQPTKKQQQTNLSDYRAITARLNLSENQAKRYIQKLSNKPTMRLLRLFNPKRCTLNDDPYECWVVSVHE